MTLEFPYLLGWKFTAEEISVDDYRVAGRDRFGHRMVIEGLEPDAALEPCGAPDTGIDKDAIKAGQQTMHETGTATALSCIGSGFMQK